MGGTLPALFLAFLTAPAGEAVPLDVTVHPLVNDALAERGGAAPVWVFFTDKGPIDTAQALSGLEQTYDPRAIERRRLRRTAPGLFDERDLPVHESYVAAVRGSGAEVHTASRWLNAVSATAGSAQVEAIAALPFVEKIQPVRALRRPPAPEPRGPVTETVQGGGPFHGWAHDQLAQINVVALNDAGFTGQGVIIAVLDTGFATNHIAFLEPDHPLQVVAEWDFVDDDPETGPEDGDHFNQHKHGTNVLGTMAAYSPEFIVGGAYDASYILAKVEDLDVEEPAEEYLFVAGLEFAEANGADVATSSVTLFNHYTQDQLDGLTSVMTVGYNTATANGMHCLMGAGNNGHDADPQTSSLVVPADGFQVIAVGAVDSAGASASFTSDGPTADGRTKPELLARGVNTWTVAHDNPFAVDQVSGTSFSTPTTAGAVACLVQAHPDWTVDQMRWALTRTADYYTANGTFDPLYVRGYGITDALAASAAVPPKPGDLDEDGTVGIADFLALLDAWGPCPAPCPPACFGDIDTDCTVGINDFLILLMNWG